MSVYSVFVGGYFIKSFADESTADFVKESLSYFVESEGLSYEVSMKCEVI